MCVCVCASGVGVDSTMECVQPNEVKTVAMETELRGLKMKRVQRVCLERTNEGEGGRKGGRDRLIKREKEKDNSEVKCRDLCLVYV